eukprot:1161702-Pelagomonas_calceolata.AAC.3
MGTAPAPLAGCRCLPAWNQHTQGEGMREDSARADAKGDSARAGAKGGSARAGAKGGSARACAKGGSARASAKGDSARAGAKGDSARASAKGDSTNYAFVNASFSDTRQEERHGKRASKRGRGEVEAWHQVSVHVQHKHEYEQACMQASAPGGFPYQILSHNACFSCQKTL